MQLRTHIAFGLLFGILFYYFLNFDFGFILVTGFAAFLPDIDLTLRKNWGVKIRHRTFTHSIWAMLLFVFITYILFRNLFLVLGLIIGYLSHLLVDSLTKNGIYWLWPIGDERQPPHIEKYHLKGPIITGDNAIETFFQSTLFAITGFLFFAKTAEINIFSLEGVIVLAVLLYAGYIIMKRIDHMIVRMIRKMKI